MTAPRIVIVPGWRDSGPGHWQSLWEERMPNVARVAQDDWVTPSRNAWVGTLTRMVPHAALPYRSIVVVSSNDPFCPVRLAGAYARAWGSEFVRIQNAGHINIDSGHGEWPLGLALLQSLIPVETLATL